MIDIWTKAVLVGAAVSFAALLVIKLGVESGKWLTDSICKSGGDR